MGSDVETKVNYTVVGLFVVVLSAALITTILWLSGDARYSKVYDTYLAYVGESVSGLNLNAPVKYRGVEVGRVKRISLYYGEKVRLELEIERGTPIKENTVAALRVQGLTGIAHVELEGGNRDARPLTAKAGEDYPVIKTRPSLLARMDTAVTDLLTSLNSVSDSINGVLDKDNRRAFKALLADMATLSHTLAARKDAIDTTLQSTARAADNAAKASAELPRLIDRIAKSAEALEKMAGDASRASVKVGKTFDKVDAGLARVADEGVPELERSLNEMRELSASLKRMSDEVGRNPGMLLLGKQPETPGPGE